MAIFGTFYSIKMCNQLNVFYAFHFIYFWHFNLNVKSKIICIILRSKIVSWLKSNLRDFCTSINKNRCWLFSQRHNADKEKKRKEACASRRRTAVKHAVMRKFLSHCVRDQRRKVICFRKLRIESPPSFIQFSAKWHHGLHN